MAVARWAPRAGLPVGLPTRLRPLLPLHVVPVVRGASRRGRRRGHSATFSARSTRQRLAAVSARPTAAGGPLRPAARGQVTPLATVRPLPACLLRRPRRRPVGPRAPRRRASLHGRLLGRLALPPCRRRGWPLLPSGPPCRLAPRRPAPPRHAGRTALMRSLGTWTGGWLVTPRRPAAAWACPRGGSASRGPGRVVRLRWRLRRVRLRRRRRRLRLRRRRRRLRLRLRRRRLRRRRRRRRLRQLRRRLRRRRRQHRRRDRGRCSRGRADRRAAR